MATERPRSFAVSSVHEGRGSLLVLRGELDVATVPHLDAFLRVCIDLGQEQIAVELSELRFMGAAGLAVLVDARRRVRQRGGELRVRNPSPSTFRLMQITGLGTLCSPGDEAVTVPAPPCRR